MRPDVGYRDHGGHFAAFEPESRIYARCGTPPGRQDRTSGLGSPGAAYGRVSVTVEMTGNVIVVATVVVGPVTVVRGPVTVVPGPVTVTV
jgi:hypothetical protein